MWIYVDLIHMLRLRGWRIGKIVFCWSYMDLGLLCMLHTPVISRGNLDYRNLHEAQILWSPKEKI